MDLYLTSGSFFAVNLGASFKVHTVYFQYDSYTSYEHHIGDSDVFIGDTLASITLARSGVHAGGFFDFQAVQTGQYVLIVRAGPYCNTVSCTNTNRFFANELLVYQVPNLIQKFGSVILEAPTPTSALYAASNLVTNLDSRSGWTNMGISASGTGTLASYNSCFITSRSSLTNDLFVLGIDHQDSYFQHAILLV